MIDTWDIKDTRCRAIFWTAVVAPVFSGSFVALRFWSRGILTKTVGVDDYASLVTLVLGTALSVLQAISTHSGMGLHIWQMNSELESSWLKWITTVSPPYVLASAGYKISLILLYLRIFGVNQRFRWACYIALVFVSGYGFSNTLTQVLGCQPLSKFWNPNAEGHCINYTAADAAYNVLFVFSDLVVAILPVPIIIKMQMKKKIKWQLVGIFASAAVAFFVSVAKFVSGIIDHHAHDRFGIGAVTYILLTLEVHTGIICCCTPTLKPAIRFVRQHTTLRSSSNTANATAKARTHKDEQRQGATELNILYDVEKAPSASPSFQNPPEKEAEHRPRSIL